MPTTSTPVWSAPHNGLVGDASAIAGTAAINQFLGTHGIQAVYQGQAITSNTFNINVNTPPDTPWQAPLSQYDIDQPFTLSGTAVGRVTVCLLPVGDGADLLVSLCQDNAGAPGTMIAQTRIPASWIYEQSAVAGTATGTANAPVTNLTGNPLATPACTAVFRNNVAQVSPYPTPALTGIAAASSTAWYYPYMIQIGGVNNNTALTSVLTTQYGSNGAFSTQQIQQPAFPVANDGSSMTCVVLDPVTSAPVVVNTGGGTSYEGPATNNAYTTALAPATGSLGTWNSQNALLYNVQNHGFCASPAGYIYAIGGRNSTGLLNSVSYAQVQNAQIGTWNYAIPLPEPIQLPFVGVCSNFLVVAGGANAAFVPQSPVWYAPINGDGSLGNWLPGPTLPIALYALNGNPFTNDYAFIISGGQPPTGTEYGAFLPVTADGPGPAWTMSNSDLGLYPGFYDQGNGAIGVGAIQPYNTPIPRALYGNYNLCPQISVPLPASGLTNGATYHVLLQQAGGDLNDYLVMTMVGGNPAPAQSSPPGQYTWTTWPNPGRDIGPAIVVYNQTPPQTVMPGFPLHLWEDQGAKITTFVNATTPDKRLLGVCEATKQAYVLNANTGFEAGISPWTCTGGAVVRSSTEAYTGACSAQITPSGTAASVYLASEIMPCMPGQWCSAVGWAWFTSAVTSTYSLSISWYTAVSGGTLISTSSNLASISATTWTEASNSFQAPAGAYGWQMRATLSGTPAASQIWYVDVIHGHWTYVGPQNSTVTQVNWPGTGWPSQGEPTGATQLA